MSAGGAAPAAARMCLEKSGSGAKGDLCAGAFGEVIVSSSSATTATATQRSVRSGFFPVPSPTCLEPLNWTGWPKLTALPISANPQAAPELLPLFPVQCRYLAAGENNGEAAPACQTDPKNFRARDAEAPGQQSTELVFNGLVGSEARRRPRQAVTTIRSRQAAFVEPLPERMRYRRRCKLAATAAASFLHKSALSAF
jgi:hypothetical protein